MLLINLSVLSLFFLPFGNLILPTLLWLKHSIHHDVDEVGRRIVNFQISWAIITYSLLALSPFLNDLLKTSFPLIFVVLILGFGFNIFTVWQTAQRLRAGNYQVCNRSIRFF